MNFDPYPADKYPFKLSDKNLKAEIDTLLSKITQTSNPMHHRLLLSYIQIGAAELNSRSNRRLSLAALLAALFSLIVAVIKSH